MKIVKTIILIAIITQMSLLDGLANTTQSQLGKKQKQLIEKFGQKATAVIAGKVSWVEHDMRRTTVQVYKDENLKELYCSGVITSQDGSYEINVEPGRYYVVAFVDSNQNGQFDLGDGMGIYGLTDWENKSQRKKSVKAIEDETTSGIDIKITSMIIEVDGRNQIVPVDSEYVKQSEKFQLELTEMFTGVSGKLVWTEHKFDNALVFAYADLTWKHRVATSECDENGNFQLNLLPGKYYLLAVIDRNQNDLFDEGDRFGIYGMDNLSSAHPQPILLEKNKFSSGLEIPIVGGQDKSGKMVSLSDQKNKVGAKKRVEILGNVTWQKHDLKNSVVFAYRDATLMTAVGHTKAQDDGKFKLELPPGKYYLIANVDVNDDGKYSTGDGVGGYGTDDITKEHPAELVISDKGASDVEISITAKYDKNGQLLAVGSGTGQELGKNISSGMSGKVIWDGHDFSSVLIAVSEVKDGNSISQFSSEEYENNQSLFSSAVFMPAKIEEDGSYILPLNPGDYYVMAIVDTNGDNAAGVEDGVGIYGTRMPTQNPPQSVSVFENRITPYINIEIGGVYIDARNIAQINGGHRANIRKRYGEPEDIFKFSKFGKQLEEWWYWTQGVMFAFEKLGVGWELDKREEFEPSSKPPESDIAAKQDGEKAKVQEAKRQEGKIAKEQVGEGVKNQHESRNTNNAMEEMPNQASQGEAIESIGTLVYYTYDDIVWGVAPNGMHRPLGVGKCPTASDNGKVLSLMDAEGNVHLIDLESDQDGILLKRSEMASAPSLSPDGSYLAFVRKMFDRSQVFIKHISTDEETPLPSTSMRATTPAWSSNGRVIAYAASGSIENSNSEENWNIYAYDTETQRIDPLSVTDKDESEPAWSPTESNVLAISRSEENHRQIWLATIDQDGNTTERQLTEFGGQNPAWLPDGSAIVYENNGQLWIVDVQGQDENPIIVDDKPVFGLDPFAGKL